MGWQPGPGSGAGASPDRDPGMPGGTPPVRDPRLAEFASLPLVAIPRPQMHCGSWSKPQRADSASLQWT